MFRIAQLKPLRTLVTTKLDTYTLSSNIGKKSKRLLNKLLSIGILKQNKETEEYVKWIEFDEQHLFYKIIKTKKDLFGLLGNGGEVLLIGLNDFSELNEITLQREFSFYVDYRYRDQILGLRIVIIPQMSGMIVLTKKQVDEISKVDMRF